ncbi:zinc metalloprotease (family M50) [Skeletonema marinoi]|uniref:Zinc metalloprotease (Family M50) n=1 Tax=Skeletonema marinoi TaxID=267567 RepID=A0AAD8YFV0_9STRA|nr:zinc metalloprotease (family M50) [Skeletonema marinoi]
MKRMQLYIALAVVGSASAFHTPSRLHPTPIHIGDKKGALIASPSTYTNSYRRDVSVGLFPAAAEQEEEEKLATPFFAANFLETRSTDATTEAAEEVNVVEATVVAEQLRAQAARIRLEAEKRTVELTLEKIEKLNTQLELMKKKEDVDAKSQKSLEEELLRLKSQLITNDKGNQTGGTSCSSCQQSINSCEVDTLYNLNRYEALEERVQKFNEAPEFMRILVAKIAGFGVDDKNPGAVNRLNVTDIVLKLYDDNIDESKGEARKMLERHMNNLGMMGTNQVTKEQIQEKVEELDQIPTFLKNIYSKEFNDTEMALMLLEEEYNDKNKKGGFFGMFGDNQKGDIGKDGERMDVGDSGAFSRLFSPDDALNGTAAGKKGGDLPFMIESLYPKSTRKEDETPDKRLVDAFLNDVVASTNSFIQAVNQCQCQGDISGGELIDKLDKRVATDARLREKITFFLLKDPFPDPEDGLVDPFNWPQLLDKANEAMDLSDAGMPVDMSWLSDMSIPLFLTFIALQLVHEVAHLAVANSKKFEISVPTLVPSILSGITSSITTLKTSPKNRQDLMEFAVAGPLAGMICSILVLSYGLALTATADPGAVQNFPGLPLAVLRQSSLGGGLVDIFLGNGVLNVPASAEGLNFLLGRTDGGRVSMALFGRSGSQGVTFISLLLMFALGFSGESDLLLFYFGFVVFAQSELEIPMRNEIDDVDFSRALVAGVALFLTVLTLIPMQ